MPQMNGLEATKIIRSGENPLGKTIPIIAMTANAFNIFCVLYNTFIQSTGGNLLLLIRSRM